ncbi:MAG: hypothetical protein AAGH99_11020 [Planctomycetota bacterium]
MKINLRISLSVLTAALALALGGAIAFAQPGSDERMGPPPHGEAGPPSMEGEGKEARGRDRERRGRRLSGEDLDAAYDIVVRLNPQLAEELQTLREEDPPGFQRALEQRFSRVRFLVELEKRDPAMFELRMSDISLGRQTTLLAKQVREARKADDKDKYEDLRDEIEAKVTEHFDVRQKIREMEIENLKRKLEELEETLDDRDDDRKDLIEQRVIELTGPDW